MPEIIDAAVITGRVGCCGHVQTMRDERKLRVKEEDKKGVMGNVYISLRPTIYFGSLNPFTW